MKASFEFSRERETHKPWSDQTVNILITLMKIIRFCLHWNAVAVEFIHSGQITGVQGDPLPLGRVSLAYVVKENVKRRNEFSNYS